jgi:hypothetical protein
MFLPPSGVEAPSNPSNSNIPAGDSDEEEVDKLIGEALLAAGQEVKKPKRERSLGDLDSGSRETARRRKK